MNPDKTIKSRYSRNSDLKIDEDIEINSDLAIDEKATFNTMPTPLPLKRRTIKPTAAGYLLIVVFFLNLLLPINFIYYIYDAETSTGHTSLSGEILSEEKVPVDNVTVEILDMNLSTKTDSKGKYSFDKIPVGVHEVRFTKDGHRIITVHKVFFSKNLLNNIGESDNTLDIPGWIQNVFIDYYTGPAMETKVIDDNLNRTLYGSVRNLTGAPVADVLIEVADNNISTISNNDGQYIFTNVTPGIINLELTSTANENITVYKILFADNKSTEYNLTYDESADRIYDDVNSKFGSIMGRLMDKKGKPIENASVVLEINSELYPNNTITANGKGDFTFTNVPIGLYNLTVLASGYYITDQVNITVRNGSTVALPDLNLQALDGALVVKEDITNNETYGCIIILVVMAIITLFGGISALQRKRYGIAFMGALIGMVPLILVATSYICGASLVCLVALLLLVFSREEFTFKPVR
jgi:hypothetical protein